MQTTSRRVVAAVLAATAAYAGGWAQFAPHVFYTTFPLPGHARVAMLGPYDEHLVRDVGSFYLALLAVTTWTILRPRAESFLLTGLAWLVFSVLHLVFHLGHLQMYAALGRAGNVVAPGGTVLLALLLLIPSPSTKEN